MTLHYLATSAEAVSFQLPDALLFPISYQQEALCLTVAVDGHCVDATLMERGKNPGHSCTVLLPVRVLRGRISNHL